MSHRPLSILDRLLSAAITLVVAALLLSWAWALLRPLLPVLVSGLALFALGRVLLNRWRY